jgi:hypothetical protein
MLAESKECLKGRENEGSEETKKERKNEELK